MTYSAPTPEIGLLLPVPGSGQKFETAVINGDFTKIDQGFTADRDRIGDLEGKILHNATTPAGTTSARDAAYGIPSGTAAQIALQNTGPRWFNTDAGAIRLEAYIAGYDVTLNPNGARGGAGWYSISALSPGSANSSSLKLFESGVAAPQTSNSVEAIPAAFVYPITMPFAAKCLLTTTFTWQAGGNAAGYVRTRVGTLGTTADELIDACRIANNSVAGGASPVTMTDIVLLPAGPLKITAGIASDSAGFAQTFNNLQFRVQLL